MNLNAWINIYLPVYFCLLDCVHRTLLISMMMLFDIHIYKYIKRYISRHSQYCIVINMYVLRIVADPFNIFRLTNCFSLAYSAYLFSYELTSLTNSAYWCHIASLKLINTGSGKSVLPNRRQPNVWTTVDLLTFEPSEKNIYEWNW